MKYVAFLRGINVGGKNIIKMADLKQMFAILGINDVSTYIQSGNVIFSSDDDEASLISQIELAIQQTFNLSISVVLRTLDDLEHIIENNPFTGIVHTNRISEIDNFYIFLFSRILSTSDIEYISLYKGVDNCTVVGGDMYVLFNSSIRNSKIANALPKIKVSVTSRNMKTIIKIVEIEKLNNNKL